MAQFKLIFLSVHAQNTFELILITLTICYCVSILYLLIGLFRIPRCSNQKIHFLSVIIAAHNEEIGLKQCLESIVDQNYPSDKYEVIIADDRSTDSTPEIIETFCRKYPHFNTVRIEDTEKAIPKKTALIKGLGIAKGEIIISTDADCKMQNSWLTSLNECFSDEIGLVIGHTSYKKPHNIWQGIDAIDYLSQRALGAAFIGIGSAYTCTASNLAYRREIFIQNREEFCNLKVRPAEDNYLLHCVHKKSEYKIAVAADQRSIVTTHGAEDFRHFLQQRFRWGAYGGNITTLGVKLFFIPVLLYYLSLWAGFAAAVINPLVLPILGVSLAAKTIVDFVFMLRATGLYSCRYLLAYFLPIAIIHPLLYPIIVIKGNLFTFEWKGQRYTKESERH